MRSLLSLTISVVMLLVATGIGRLLQRSWRADRPEPYDAAPAESPPDASGLAAPDSSSRISSLENQVPDTIVADKAARMTDGDAGERLVLDASLGLGVVSFVIFAASALQILQVGPGIAIAAVTIGLSVRGLPDVLGDLAALLRRLVHPASLYSFAVTEFLIALGVAALIPALAPPAMADWDSLAYHLAVPKLFIQHGGFYYIHFTTHSNFPFLVEMLYIPGLALRDPVAAKLMHYWMGVLLIGAVTILARKHVLPSAAPTAALAVAGMPIVLWEATTAYVDLATALYTVIALHLMMNHLGVSSACQIPQSARTCQSSERLLRRDVIYIVASGLAAGFAASTKMIGLALIPMIGVWLIAAGGSARWRSTLIFTGIAVVTCLPWYAKSTIYTGNPVYPFFYSIFGGRDWSLELARNYASLQKQFGMGRGIDSFLLLPYNLAFHSEAFYDRPGLYVGPLMIVSVPVIAVARYRSSKLLGLVLFSLAQTALWFTLSQQSRYLIPGLAVIAIAVAGLVHTDERFRLTRIALAIVFAATAVFGLVVQLWPEIRQTAPVAVCAESRQAYLERRLDIYPAQQFMNEFLPTKARVALFGDTRGFYLNRAYVWADWGHNSMFSRKFASGWQLASYLKKHGFTYVMVNFGIAFPSREKAAGTSRAVYDAIESGLFEQVYPSENWGAVGVYRIR